MPLIEVDGIGKVLIRLLIELSSSVSSELMASNEFRCSLSREGGGVLGYLVGTEGIL